MHDAVLLVHAVCSCAGMYEQHIGWPHTQHLTYVANHLLFQTCTAGAREMDLSPSTGVYQASHAPLPDVTIVFAVVAGAAGFTFKRSRSDTRYVNKVIRRCMLQQLAVLPGGDGYLCRVGRCAVFRVRVGNRC